MTTEAPSALDFTLPTAVFDQILPAIAEVLDLAQDPNAAQNIQTRQALVQSTNQLKDQFAKAKEIAHSLPGGDLTLDQQDVLIDLLQKIRDHKRELLATFTTAPISSSEKDIEMQ